MSEVSDALWEAGGQSGGSVRECQCGIVWFNEGDWDWNDGELELLRENERATPEKYKESHDGLNSTCLFGREWVWQCEGCQEKLLDYGEFLWSNRHSISKFFNRRIEENLAKAKTEARDLKINIDNEK